MKSRAVSGETAASTRVSQRAGAADSVGLKALAAGAFLLLATALCVRSLLGEMWTIFAADLLDPAGTKLSGSLSVRYTVYLLAAAGILLGAGYAACLRRKWRVSGLEPGALLLFVAALISVPFASDKRLAINAATDTILPLIAAAALYQLLVRSTVWRRALLACLIAVTAANCWRATAQRSWEYDQAWQRYQKDRGGTLQRMGYSPDDPAAARYEDRLKARQPMGYFQHPNVLASFLVLGLAATFAAVAGFRRRRTPTPATKPADVLGGRLAATDRVPGWLGAVAIVVLLLLALWQLVTIRWVGSAGALVGLLAGLAAAPLLWWLRDRPKWLAIVLVSGVVLLQAALVALALDAPRLYPSLAARGGKVKSLAVRLNYWEGAARLFAEHPVRGVGPGQFPSQYLKVKPIYAAEAVADPHNWLLTLAAEWGVVGVLGVLVALGAAGRSALRTLGLAAEEDQRSIVSPLVPAALVLLICWWLAISDVAPSARTMGVLIPVIVSLAAMVFSGLSRSGGQQGQVILLAGLIGFFVHGTVDTAPGAPGAGWAFWAIAALAMAWKGTRAEAGEPATPARRRGSLAGAAVAAACALAVIAVTIQPKRSTGLMEQARLALAAQQQAQSARQFDEAMRQGDRATQLFRQAAEVDTLDPLPLHAAALLQSRLIAFAPRRDVFYLQQGVALYDAAVQRDPLNYMRWRNVAIAQMYLACRVEDMQGIEQAVATMRRALDLYPNSPADWVELGKMASVTGSKVPDRPALLRIGIDAIDEALRRDQGWPGEDAQKFTAARRAELLQMRQELMRKLNAAEATQPAATRQAGG